MLESKQTLIRKGLNIAMEAAKYQFNAKLFNDITECLQDYRQSLNGAKPTTKTFRKTGLERIVSLHTGLNITIEIKESQWPNAYAVIPDINRNNTIFSSYWLPYLNDREADAALKNRDYLDGTVDRERGHVGGWFSTLGCVFAVTDSLMTHKTGKEFTWTEDEIAAIILHELGHLFTLFEGLSRTWRRNVILESRLNEYRKAGTPMQRLRIVDELKAEKLLNRDFEANEIVNAGDQEKASLLILTKSQRMIATDPATACHDNTSYEAASDQFAVRMGAGRSLSNALMKLHTMSNFNTNVKYILNGLRWAMFGLSASSFVFGLFMGPASAILCSIFGVCFAIETIALGVGAQYFVTYDEPADRFKRIRQEVITALKDKTVPEAISKEVLDYLDTIDKQLKDNARHLAEHKGPQQWIVEHCIPFAIMNKNTKTHQQTLEYLQNNDLYADAHRFR